MFLQRTLFVIGVWLAIVPVALGAGVPTRSEAAWPVIGAVALACATRPQLCVAVVSTAGALIASASTLTEEELNDVYAALVDWYDSWAPGDTAHWESRFDGAAVYWTAEDAETMQAVVEAALSTGWSLSPSGCVSPCPTVIQDEKWYRTELASAWSSGIQDTTYLELEFLNVGASGSGTIRAEYAAPPDTVGRVQWLRRSAGVGSYGSVDLNNTDSLDTHAWEHHQETMTNLGAPYDWKIVLKWPTTSQMSTCTGACEIGWAVGGMWLDATTDLALLDIDDLGIAASVAVATYPISDGATRRVYVPQDSDDIATMNPTNPNPAITRVDGTTGALIGAETPGTVTGDSLTDAANQSWWEGMFGGVVGALQTIWSKLHEMASTLTSTLTAVQAIPDAIVSSLTAALTPTVGIQARTTALADVAEVRAPFSWYSGVTTSLEGLFAADAAGCVTLELGPMPSYAVPYFGSETPMELCAPAGLSAITLPLSRLVAWALVVVYAIARIHGFLNGGMKEGTQMRLFE